LPEAQPMADVAARDPPATPCLHGGRGGGQARSEKEKKIILIILLILSKILKRKKHIKSVANYT